MIFFTLSPFWNFPWLKFFNIPTFHHWFFTKWQNQTRPMALRCTSFQYCGRYLKFVITGDRDKNDEIGRKNVNYFSLKRYSKWTSLPTTCLVGGDSNDLPPVLFIFCHPFVVMFLLSKRLHQTQKYIDFSIYIYCLWYIHVYSSSSSNFNDKILFKFW